MLLTYRGVSSLESQFHCLAGFSLCSPSAAKREREGLKLEEDLQNLLMLWDTLPIYVLSHTFTFLLIVLWFKVQIKSTTLTFLSNACFALRVRSISSPCRLMLVREWFFKALIQRKNYGEHNYFLFEMSYLLPYCFSFCNARWHHDFICFQFFSSCCIQVLVETSDIWRFAWGVDFTVCHKSSAHKHERPTGENIK